MKKSANQPSNGAISAGVGGKGPTDEQPVARRSPHPLLAAALPYAQLIRLDKPIGFIIVFLPYTIGLFFAATINRTVLPVEVLLNRGRILLAGSIVLRSAGCTWDDIVDQDLDRNVERSRNRPLPRGAVSTTQALIFMAALCVPGIILLLLLPWACSADAAFIIVLSAGYPYMKRFTSYTQVVLGLTIGFAVVLSMHSLDVDPLAADHFIPTLSLWSAIALLMMLYDIVYAGQDTKDDVTAGIMSMAVYFRHHVRLVITIEAAMIVALLYIVGAAGGLSYRYFAMTVGGSGCSLMVMIAAMDLKVPASCHKYCGGAYIITSFSMLLGFLWEYISRL